MKKKQIYSIILIVGIALVVAAVSIPLVSYIVQQNAAKEARELVSQLKLLMPSSYGAALDDRVNTVMPSMEVGGENFCGIIEIPTYNADLPVCQIWDQGKLSKYPCRFTGSIYDRSLIIGGSDNDGQFDFMKEISAGETVYVTDMTGGRYRYKVSDIRRVNKLSSEYLMGFEGDLVFFAKNTTTLDYTVVICNIG